jgi:hypothetical protein
MIFWSNDFSEILGCLDLFAVSILFFNSRLCRRTVHLRRVFFFGGGAGGGGVTKFFFFFPL